MSKYLKKCLFTLLILTVPYMNSASKAFFVPTEEDKAAHAMAFTAHQQEDPLEEQVQINQGSIKQGFSDMMKLAKEDIKSGAANVAGTGYSIWMSLMNKPIETLVVGGVCTLAAAEAVTCFCTCNGNAVKQSCGYVGYIQDYNCPKNCLPLGYKNYTCGVTSPEVPEVIGNFSAPYANGWVTCIASKIKQTCAFVGYRGCDNGQLACRNLGFPYSACVF